MMIHYNDMILGLQLPLAGYPQEAQTEALLGAVVRSSGPRQVVAATAVAAACGAHGIRPGGR